MKTISSLILLFALTMNVYAQTTNDNRDSNESNQNGNEIQTSTVNTNNNNGNVLNVLNLPTNFPGLSESERNLLESNLIDIEGTMLLRHRGGNGGDTIASEFTTIAKNASQVWTELCKEVDFDLCDYADQFADMLNKESKDFVKVLSAPSVLAYDDKPRDAVNFVDANGVKNIVVATDRWQEISKDYYQKYDRRIIIVLHEYFSLLGLESSDYYPRSRDLLTIIKSYGYNISKISSNKSLASGCTINIEANENVDDSLYRDLVTFMTEKNYETKDVSTQARYIMKANLNCDSSGFLHHACSVYTEIVDTYKYNEVVYDSFETHKAWLRKNKVIDIAFNNALSGISSCK